MNKREVEKAIAVLLVAVAFFFVAYSEASDRISGAYSSNNLYKDCTDSDKANSPTIRGTITASQLDRKTNTYYPIIPIVDECIGTNRVQEWRCTSYHGPTRVGYEVYCADGMVCRDGACRP